MRIHQQRHAGERVPDRRGSFDVVGGAHGGTHLVRRESCRGQLARLRDVTARWHVHARACVGPDSVPSPTQDVAHGAIGRLAGDIPERHVDTSEQLRQLNRVKSTLRPDLVPERVDGQRILALQNRADSLANLRGHGGWSPAPIAHVARVSGAPAGDAFVGSDLDQHRVALEYRTFAQREPHFERFLERVREQVGLDSGDAHGTRSSINALRSLCDDQGLLSR